jgi:hypothetical protein
MTSFYILVQTVSGGRLRINLEPSCPFVLLDEGPDFVIGHRFH